MTTSEGITGKSNIDHRFFTVRQAATYLGMSSATVRKYSDLGELLCRRLGKNRMFRKEDLDLFIDSRPPWLHNSRQVNFKAGGRNGYFPLAR